MLETYIHQLGQELQMEDLISGSEEEGYWLPFDENIEIQISLAPEGLFFKSLIISCPSVNKEAFLIKVMEANLFGRGTRQAIIGLTDDENMLTLSGELRYNSNYQQFKEMLEDLVTMIDFWRNEALKHQ